MQPNERRVLAHPTASGFASHRFQWFANLQPGWHSAAAPRHSPVALRPTVSGGLPNRDPANVASERIRYLSPVALQSHSFLWFALTHLVPPSRPRPAAGLSAGPPPFYAGFLRLSSDIYTDRPPPAAWEVRRAYPMAWPLSRSLPGGDCRAVSPPPGEVWSFGKCPAPLQECVLSCKCTSGSILKRIPH